MRKHLGFVLDSRLRAQSLILSVVVAGCGATVYTRTGEAIEGRIDGSDTDTIYLTTKDGAQIPIGRDRLRSIDHPGNVAAVLSPLPLLGGASLAAMDAFAPGAKSNTKGTVFLTCGVVGSVAMLVGGLIIWGGSLSRASAYDWTGPATAEAPSD